MSVYTAVSEAELLAFLADYPVGELRGFEGISAGIENTNYFVDTTDGRWVLTLFERAAEEDLPWFLGLMDHLAHRGVPSASPLADHRGRLLTRLNGKPAALVHRLDGAHVMQPTPAHCGELGRVLAEMHQAGQSFKYERQDCRGQRWRQQTAEQVLPKLSSDDAALLEDEMAFQAAHLNRQLPEGVIHSDLFRDNVLFHEDRLSGLIDFYFACNGELLYDLAITANDWCLMQQDADAPARYQALIAGYAEVRPFTEEEIAAWPLMLRAGTLRFWLSRLFDLHFPRDGEMTQTKDPDEFRDLLLRHREQPPSLS
ncbi:MAG: homoserine kinase [Salinisphaeraceae bacterium]|nr:homoserine kinase [Salinisphaeraceae bacterium]